MIARLLAAVFLVTGPLMIGAAATAEAQLPIPRLRPEQANHSRYLSDADFIRFREGLDAADDEDWERLRELRREIVDATARDVLLWRLALGDENTSFFELDLAMRELDGWARDYNIQIEAESKIGGTGLDAAFIVGWFEMNPPVTGDGKIAYADALFATGRTQEGETVLREAWRTERYSLAEQSDIIERHGDHLTEEDHIARIDMLIWASHGSGAYYLRTHARRLLTQIDGSDRQLAVARLRLAGRQSGVDSAIRAVPVSRQNDPGLVFERARWRRRSGLDYEALPLLLALPNSHSDVQALEMMWLERKLMVLDLVRDDRHQEAYELSAAHGMSEGADFADAEFLAGWLSLVHLDEPARAYEHFSHLAENVSTPVSVSRGYYWMARAADGMGDHALAAEHYAQAAEHSTAFYGQMALAQGAEINPELALAPEPEPGEDARRRFESRPQIRALRLLAEQGEDYWFRLMMYRMDDVLEDPEEMVLLSRLAVEYLRLRQAVRAAKAARVRGVILPQSAYPTIDLPETRYSAPEAALVHSVIRQETEFEQFAVSGAGARGMMQLMPATARQTARQLGEPYQFDWLTYDPHYNLTLGMAHLDEVVDEFDGSYVVALAAYNAGAHRARRWIENYGDPRTGEIDPIDWVESIPFSETRNYVQRVLENLQVYRSRLNGDQPAPLLIERDLGGPIDPVN